MTPSQCGRWIEVVSHLDPKYGGLSSSVPVLGERIARGHDLHISLAAFCRPEEHYRPSGYDSSQIKFWPSSRKPWLADQLRNGSLLPAFEDSFRAMDGVHIHGLWEQSTTTAARTARTMKIPYIVSAHGMLEPWALQNGRLKKLVYSFLIERSNLAHAACLHALTRTEADQYRRFGARSPIAIIPNGVEIPDHPDPRLFFDRFPDLEEKRLVLFLGRLHPKKGLDLLIESWVGLCKLYPEAHLVLAGPDSEGTRARIEQLLAKHRIARRVTFTGMLREATKWSAYAASEIFVLPSYSEGLSVSVLEAMGMGLPVVITDTCNMPEIERYRAGLLIKPDSDQLAAALASLLDNALHENAAIGARGTELVQSRYSWTVVAEQMASLYQWLAGGSHPANVNFVFPEAA